MRAGKLLRTSPQQNTLTSYSYAIDDSQFSDTPCCSIANKLLEKYIATPSRRNEKERKRPRIEQDDGPGTQKDNAERESGTQKDAERGSGTQEDDAEHRSRTQKRNAERKIAEILAGIIQKGLSQLALTPPDPCSMSLYLDEEASYSDYAARLILLAEQQFETQIASSWCIRFLAGCISLASPSLPALPAKASSVEENGDIVRRQRSIARVVNLIVTGLWGSWYDNAFLVYHAFAGEPELNIYAIFPSDIG
jgi:hypothetical protein